MCRSGQLNGFMPVNPYKNLICRMFYFIRSPWWLRKIYKQCIWQMPGTEKVLYLSFDDGPHPGITPFVLDELKKYDARATFFCIGKNLLQHPAVYRRMLDEGHGVGNHSFRHLNGWKTKDQVYLDDIAAAKKHIDSNLYRPPYGRITRFQLRILRQPAFRLRTIMWTVLSGDFDKALSGEQCYQNVIRHAKSGSIIVFHDSEKAALRMKYALPLVLSYFREKGFRFEKIRLESE